MTGKLRLIGLSGGIGTGKSAAARMIAGAGIPIGGILEVGHGDAHQANAGFWRVDRPDQGEGGGAAKLGKVLIGTVHGDLHDIGKMGIPDRVLGKSGPLDADEWSLMQKHTLIGERMLSVSPALGPVARLVRSSHERWDGRGYPDGLAGRQIPLGARIVAVCDAFRAMIERRSYREPMTQREALGELRDNAGTQFDTECVRALMSVLVTRGSDDEQVPLHRPAHAA